MTGSEFRRARRLPRRIVFAEDHHVFPGLELRITGFTVGEWLDFTVGEMVAAFADRLIEWNWVDADTGEAVPATPEGVTSIDAQDLATLVAEWKTRVTGVHPLPFAPTPAVLAGRRNGAMEASIPMGSTPPSGDN